MALKDTNYRAFDTLDVIAYVTAHQGSNLSRDIEPTSIDPKTGVIVLPNIAGGYEKMVDLNNVDELNKARAELKEKLPTHFTLAVAHRTDDDRVIVAQREKGDRYRFSQTTAPFGDLTVHTEPPCEVRTRIVKDAEMTEQEIPRLAIWLDTQMQNQSGSNRADIIRVTTDGRVTLNRVLLLWLDGRFRLVSETGWMGQLMLKAIPTDYLLKSDDSRHHSAFYGNDDVQALLRKYVFVPDMGYPSIEGWIQMLLLPKFRQLVQSTDDLEVWDGSEYFWSKPDPKILTEPDTGVVEWYVHGTGGAAMGYVHLRAPITHNGRTVDKVQIKHHTIDSERDEQGLKKIRTGDIVRIHKIVNMDVTQGSGPKARTVPHAPLAFVGVIYKRREEGEEPLETSAAA